MQAILVLLSLAGSVVADVYQVPLVQIESEATEILQGGKWTAHAKQWHAREGEDANFTSKDIYAHKIYAGWDDSYLVANITIGTPPQLFRVVLDTSSAISWVVDYNCAAVVPPYCDESTCDSGFACKVFCEHQDCCAIKRKKENPCRGKGYFKSSKSSTYANSTGKWDVVLNHEVVAEGFYGNDTIRLGDPGSKQLTIPGAQFGQATTMSGRMSERRFDGVVGLGLHSTRAIFERALALELIEPIFTVFMTPRGATTNNVFGGVFTYGGQDTVNCEKVIAYEDLTKSAHSWSFKLQKVTSGSYSSSGDEEEGWDDVASNTAYPFIGGPSEEVQAIFKENNVKWSHEVMDNVIDCNSKFSIEFVIGNNTYTVGPENLVQHVGGNVCIVTLVELEEDDEDPSWEIGYPFMRQFCHTYDTGNRRIGFAKPHKK